LEERDVEGKGRRGKWRRSWRLESGKWKVENRE